MSHAPTRLIDLRSLFVVKKSLNVAVVGLSFGQGYLPALRAHPEVATVGVCDPHEATLQAVSTHHGISARHCHRTVGEVLASGLYDAVMLLSPIPFHADQSVAVLNAGLHCACTVPMATTLADCRRVVEARKASGKTYCLLETSLANNEFHFIHDLVRSGEMGDLQFLRGVWFNHLDQHPQWWHGLPPMHYITHPLAPLFSVGPSDLYRESELGDRRYYNHRLAMRVIADLLGRSDLTEARRITDLAIRLWEQQPEMVTAARQPIPNRIGRRDQLAWLLLIKLGLQTGEPAAEQTAKEIESLVADYRAEDRFNCGVYRARLPLYRWMAAPPGPSLSELPALVDEHVVKDREAANTLQFLGRPETFTPKQNSPYELYRRTSRNNFWVGLRDRLEGRDEESQKNLQAYLQRHVSNPLESEPFELAASATLTKNKTP